MAPGHHEQIGEGGSGSRRELRLPKVAQEMVPRGALVIAQETTPNVGLGRLQLPAPARSPAPGFTWVTWAWGRGRGGGGVAGGRAGQGG